MGREVVGGVGWWAVRRPERCVDRALHCTGKRTDGSRVYRPTPPTDSQAVRHESTSNHNTVVAVGWAYKVWSVCMSATLFQQPEEVRIQLSDAAECVDGRILLHRVLMEVGVLGAAEAEQSDGGAVVQAVEDE